MEAAVFWHVTQHGLIKSFVFRKSLLDWYSGTMYFTFLEFHSSWRWRQQASPKRQKRFDNSKRRHTLKDLNLHQHHTTNLNFVILISVGKLQAPPKRRQLLLIVIPSYRIRLESLLQPLWGIITHVAKRGCRRCCQGLGRHPVPRLNSSNNNNHNNNKNNKNKNNVPGTHEINN